MECLLCNRTANSVFNSTHLPEWQGLCCGACGLHHRSSFNQDKTTLTTWKIADISTKIHVAPKNKELLLIKVGTPCSQWALGPFRCGSTKAMSTYPSRSVPRAVIWPWARFGMEVPLR